MSGQIGEPLTVREVELGAIIGAYNQVTERLKESHEKLQHEVGRLTEELVSKNRALARRERLAALGEMAAGLAHEIRNPLGGIQLYASMLKKDLRDDARLGELARKIGTGVGMLNSLVGDVLAFAGDVEPRFEPVRPADVLMQATELASGRAEDRGVLIEVDSGEMDVALLGDEQQLVRALLNLVLNGVDAVGVGGWVRVSAETASGEAGMVCVGVADNGSGIAPELLDRIFNPFFTTKDSGTGLGLSIVHQICEAHGGRVRAANREGGGAEFTLTLPVALPPVEAGVSSNEKELW